MSELAMTAEDQVAIWAVDFGRLHLRSYTCVVDREPSGREILDAAERGVERVEVDLGELPDGLADLIEHLNNVLKRIPAKYRASAKFDISGTQDGYAEVTATYSRPEPMNKWRARQADVERRRLLWAAKTAERERVEYERLAAKFGPSPLDR